MHAWECRHDIETLQDYLDGTLSACDAIALTERMKECPACRREYAALKRTQELARCAAVPASGDVRERTMARFRHTVAPQPERYAPRLPMWRRAGLAVALAAAVAFCGLIRLSLLEPEPLDADAVVIEASLPSNSELDMMTSLHAASSHALPGHDTATHRDAMGDANARLTLPPIVGR